MELSQEDLELLEIAKRNKKELIKLDADKEKNELKAKLTKIEEDIESYTQKIKDLREEKKAVRAELKAL